jgi:hypothetical protein
MAKNICFLPICQQVSFPPQKSEKWLAVIWHIAISSG